MNDDIKVSICCITYNQANFIAQTLDSFLSQKTNFAYEIIIHDDASTDGTNDIIKEYVEKYDNIRYILQKENQYSKDVNIEKEFVFPIARGKYIAYCEGDDYWCDDGKLQEQYDAMELHPECSMCTHYTELISSDTGKVIGELPHKKFKLTTGIIDKELLFRIISVGVFHLSSCFFRKKYIGEYVSTPPDYVDVMSEDVGYMFFFGLRDSVYFINSTMSSYRKNVEGSWTRRVAKVPSEYKRMLERQILATELFLKHLNRKYPEYTHYFEDQNNFYKLKIAFINRQYKTVLSKENRKHFRRLTKKMQIIACVGSVCPWLIHGYKKLKRSAN